MPLTRTAHARPRLAPLGRRPLTARLDQDARYVEVSEEYAALFGLSARVLRGKRARDVVGQAYWAAVEPYVEMALRGEPASFTETLPVGDGERVVEAHYVPYAGGFTALLFDRTEELRDENAFAALFAQAGEGIGETDMRGRFVRVNDRCCEILGRRREEVVGKTVRDFTYPGDPVLDAKALERLAKDTGRVFMEKRFTRPDGSPVWVTVSVSILRGESGRAVGAMAVIHDLTTRRKAQAQLRLSEERYRALGESAPIGIFSADAQGNATYANPRLLEIFGLKGADAVGTDWLKAVHPEDRERLLEERARARQEGRELLVEYRVVHPDGEVRWVRARTRPIIDEGGRHLGHTGTLEDVTERRIEELERAALLSQVQEERRRLSDIFDNLPAMVWETRGVTPEDLQVTYISPYACALTGVPLSEYLTRTGVGLNMVHAEDRAAAGEAIRLSLATGEPARYEFRLASRDGRLYWMEARSRPVLDAQGRVTGTRGVALDITARKQAEEAMRRGEEAQREFIANVSHDFRTPLASIKGYAETLLRPDAAPSPSTRRTFTRTILRNAERLSSLVEDVLTLSSLDSGAARPEPEAVDLRAFAAELAEELAPVLRARKVALRREVPAGLSARFDRLHLAQVMHNLLGNAARYNRPGGWIRVSARRAGGLVEVCVADSGVGISAEHLPRVFDRFYRVDRVRSSAAKASGLGLHIVKRLVEAAGGRVWATSRPGRGSRFYFTAPLVE